MGVPIDPRTQLPVADNIVKTEHIVWVDFLFDNSVASEIPNTLSALPFLKDTLTKVEQIISEATAVA
jgi:hypothetical protein